MNGAVVMYAVAVFVTIAALAAFALPATTPPARVRRRIGVTMLAALAVILYGYATALMQWSMVS